MAPPACEAYNQATIAWTWDRKALMTDYYPLIADAVADLDKNTGDARHALYERARTVLRGHLRSLTPPLPESDIACECESLEEAIRKVEAESGAGLTGEAAPSAPVPNPWERQPQWEPLSPEQDGAPTRRESSLRRPRLQPALQRQAVEAVAPEPTGSLRMLIAAFLGGLLVLALASGLYWKRDFLRALLVRSPATEAQHEDSVGQSPQQGSSATGETTTARGFPVAPRAMLYEGDPADALAKRYVGSVVWRTEAVSPGPGQVPEVAIRALLEVPERRISMSMLLRRNTDKTLPASHMIEIIFNLPADFPFGGISNVPAILMKQAEQTRGAPLAGLSVKVISGFFLVGLSESDMQRNLELLKERSWFDIPVIYNNGRRAILAVEKGPSGEQAFREAFAAWRE